MDIVSSIIPLFLIIAVGSLLKMLRIADYDWIKILNSFALYIAFPALIINSFLALKEIDYRLFLFNFGWLLGLSIAVVLVLKLFKMKKEMLNTYLVCIIFGNIAYLGYPIITSVIPSSEQTVSLVIASSLIVLFGFILAYLEYTKAERFSLGLFKNLIKNPLVLAVLVGFLLSMLHFKSPFILDKALTMLASSASPTALVALGIFLVRHIKWDMALMHAVIITAIKLLVLPLIFFLLDRNMAIVVLEAAMPVAVTTFTLAEQYPMKKETVLYAIILSTIFSAITLPIISSFLI